MGGSTCTNDHSRPSDARRTIPTVNRTPKLTICATGHSPPLGVRLSVLVSGVFFEVLLRDAVEGKTSNGTVEKRRGHTPSTARTAPAAEVVAIDPDEAFVHTDTF